MSERVRLAIVTSHPVQYYAPWFRHLATHLRADLRVFYLWDFGVSEQVDDEFQRHVRWDTDLLGGYSHEFVPNQARPPGTQRFRGLDNPTLSRQLAAWRPDAVMLLGYGWLSPLKLALTWNRCPLILRGDSHDLGRGRKPAWRRVLRQTALRILFRRFSAFAAVGRANRAHYLAHGVPAERIFSVPHCVDNDRFRAAASKMSRPALRRELGLEPDRFVIGFAGKFVPKKRPDLLVRAFLRLPPENLSLLLVGDGPLEGQLRHLAANSAAVQIRPFQNQQAMPRVLAACDLVVLPSEGPEETWGLIVNEAMAVGVPCVVSSDVGCGADLIEEDRTGWTFPAGDEAALAAKLQHAIKSIRTQPEALRTNVQQKIAQYSYTTASGQLQALLDALLASRTQATV